jgi:hypothetical protein
MKKTKITSTRVAPTRSYVSQAVRYSLPEGIREGVSYSDEELIRALAQTAVQLERDGVRLISTTWGPFARFQKEVSDAVSVPVYLSAVTQIPWIKVCLKKPERIAILCDDKSRLTPELLTACHVDPEDLKRCIPVDVWDLPLCAKAKADRTHYNYDALGQEIADFTANLQREHPEIGAILFECLSLPSFAADIQRAVSLPVYDTVTMLKYAAGGCCRRQFEGFV